MSSLDNRKLVYCSGPLFSPEEVKTMSQIAKVLEKHGYETFLPHRDGLEAYTMNSVNNPLVNAPIFKPLLKFISKAIFALDVYQVISRCSCFVFNMNGRVPDEGGVAETAMAYVHGKPLVIYKNDGRGWCGSINNPMLSGTVGNRYIRNIEEIPAVIEQVLSDLPPQNTSEDQDLPPYVRKVNRRGKLVWKILQAVTFLRPPNIMDRN